MVVNPDQEEDKQDL